MIVRWLPLDVENILSIPLVDRAMSDELIWHYDANGCFSMKSAYHLGYDSSNLGYGNLGLIWKKFWRTRKNLIFFWRVLMEA